MLAAVLSCVAVMGPNPLGARALAEANDPREPPNFDPWIPYDSICISNSCIFGPVLPTRIDLCYEKFEYSFYSRVCDRNPKPSLRQLRPRRPIKASVTSANPLSLT
ncbi:hypothetical protein BGY98DRAFT_1101448 [Russula aff. rugulosa BPL654]|nr:hypothetical protein BGY98DRAFT_1101448 [Russula aff. rugulosa BPL654]